MTRPSEEVLAQEMRDGAEMAAEGLLALPLAEAAPLFQARLQALLDGARERLNP